MKGDSDTLVKRGVLCSSEDTSSCFADGKVLYEYHSVLIKVKVRYPRPPLSSLSEGRALVEAMDM